MPSKLAYTHLKINEDITCVAGYYTPLKEVRLPYNGREVLYVVGHAVIESSCCGVGSWGYVLVPGYILKWQSKTNQTGLPVSEVEPVLKEKARNDIRHIITAREAVSPVEFW